MTIQLYVSGRTSSDLLANPMSKRALPALNYQIVAQSAKDVQNVQNAPNTKATKSSNCSADHRHDKDYRAEQMVRHYALLSAPYRFPILTEPF